MEQQPCRRRTARRTSPPGSLVYEGNMTRLSRPSAVLELDGEHLSLADACRILDAEVDRLSLTPAARQRIGRAHACLVDLLQRGETIYGVNTGFGKLSSQRIEPHEVLALQENLLRSHAVGMGSLLPLGVVRLAVALR